MKWNLNKSMRAALLAAGLLLAALPAAANPVTAASREERVALSLASGRNIEARLRLPVATAAGERLPVLMLFGGFKGAAGVLDLVRSEEPLIFASFDYPYDPPRKFIFPYSLRHLPEFKQALAETFEGIEVLYAHLRARPGVDPARITIAGASAGAPFATISAARLGIPGLVVVHGFGSTREVIAQQFIRKWEPKRGRWVRGPARALASFAVWYLEIAHAEEYARQLRSGQQVLMLTATEDSFIPRTASDALWQALQQSGARSERLEMPGDHLRSGAELQIAEILQRALVWMKTQNLL